MMQFKDIKKLSELQVFNVLRKGRIYSVRVYSAKTDQPETVIILNCLKGLDYPVLSAPRLRYWGLVHDTSWGSSTVLGLLEAKRKAALMNV